MSTTTPSDEHSVNKIAGLRPVLEVNWLAARAEALVPYSLELKSGTLIALANEVRLTSLKLGAETKISHRICAVGTRFGSGTI